MKVLMRFALIAGGIAGFAAPTVAQPVRCEALFVANAKAAEPSVLQAQVDQARELAQVAARLQRTRSVGVRLGPGRSLFVQIVEPAKPGGVTLLLLPGVNRSLMVSDPGVIEHVKRGLGVVSVQFSTQPFSIATLKADERPMFRDQSLSLNDLAGEIENLAAQLRSEGIQNLVPVSLSYSGAVSARLKGFDLVIETSPMTSTAATNPELDRYRQTLKAGELWNPIFGPGITRGLLDTAYRTQWQKQVETILNQFPSLPKDRRDDMVEGYTTLSRAAEDFDWKIEIPRDRVARRVFFVAGNEDPPLLKHQLQTFLNYRKRVPTATLILIAESGHLIPGDQPVVFAELLNRYLQSPAADQSGVFIVVPSKGSVSRYEDREADRVIHEMLKGLETPK